MIELLVVMVIIAVLLTIVVPRYFGSVDRTKEVVLRENLKIVRDTLDKFHADTGRYPSSLEELVQKKYLKALPVDPITESNSSWQVIPPDDPVKGGVADIKSSASGVSRDGIPYASF